MSDLGWKLGSTALPCLILAYTSLALFCTTKKAWVKPLIYVFGSLTVLLLCAGILVGTWS